MAVYKIFISSPGDVGRERHLAEQVIRRVAVEFQNRVEVQRYFWEYEPMESTRDYQENIPLTSAFDLVICILWKRLGSPLSVKHQRPDGGQWRSGTEFELVTAIESKKARGAPDIFIFKNDTRPTFEADEEGSGAKTEVDLAQWKALIAFIKEWCEGVQDGQRVFTAALNRYQALDQFEQVLEKLLIGKLNERFPPASDPSDSDRRSLRPPPPSWTQGSPFRGLEAFQFRHAPVFCGRTHAIGEVLDRLRRKAAHGRPFVLILGASGSGKSSLAMAGVLPLLVKPGTIEGVGLWRRVVFRPGGQTEVGDLFDRLAATMVRRQQEGEGLPELISGRTTIEQVAADLRADPKAAALLVRSALNQAAVLYREAEAQKLRSWIAESHAENRTADVERYGRLLGDLTTREARLALVIDQAEELFTSDDLNRHPELRKDFAVALDALAASGGVFVLATLRSDFYAQIQQLPAFVDLKEADGQFDLLPAQPAEITQMIRQPAIAAGLRFEKDPETQEGLDEVLADQVKAEPRLLPLLEFALDELYKEHTADGLLTFEAYRVHLDGSIVRALAKRADATLEGLPEVSRDAFRSVMRRLATTADEIAAGVVKGQQLDVIEKGSSGPTFQRQRVPYDQLTAYPPGAKALVDAFVTARLLVVELGKADDQKSEVTVAHEALFEHWAALKNLLLAERDDLILPRARVAASHERWRAQNRSSDFLLPPGKQLSEAEQLVAEYGEELTPELKTYVAASMAQAHAQQKRRQRLLIAALLVFAVLAVAASGAAIFGFWQKGVAEERERDATAMLFLSRADQMSKAQNAEAALALTRAAYLKQPSFQTRNALIDRLILASPYFKESFAGGGDGVTALAWSGNSSKFAIGLRNGSIDLWEEGHSVTTLVDRRGNENERLGVLDLTFVEEGRSIAAVFESGECQTYSVDSRSRQRSTMLQKSFLTLGAVSPDGRRIAFSHTGSLPSEIKDAKGDEIIVVNPGSSGDPTCLRFSSDSARLAVGFHGGGVALLELNKMTSCRGTDQRIVLTAAWQPAGSLLALGLQGSGLEIWETSPTPSKLAEQSFTEHNITSLDWNPIHGQLAQAVRGEVKLCQPAPKNPQKDAILEIPFSASHQSNVNIVRWSPDGEWLASGDDDGVVKVWSLKQRGVARHLDAGSPLHGLRASPDGKWISAGTEDGRVLLWNTGTQLIEYEIKNGNKVVNCIAWQPEKDTFACADANGTIHLYGPPWQKPYQDLASDHGEIWQLAWSPGGQTLFFTSQDGTVNSWNPKNQASEVVHTGVPPALGLAVSPDGARLAMSSTDGYITVQRVADGQILAHYKAHADSIGCLAWSPNGRQIASAGNDGLVALSDPDTGTVIQLLKTPTAASDAVYVETVAFSPDGTEIAAAGQAAAGQPAYIHIWCAATGKALWQAAMHEKSIWHLHWAAPELLLTSSSDGRVGCLDPREQSWLARAAELTRHLPREMSEK
jgi:WD40 repeat protein